MTQSSDPATMLALAEEIFGQTYTLVKHLKQNSIAEPSLAVGASTELWSSHAEEIAVTKTSIFGLTKQLTKLLQGPRGFLHEYVSSNWEYGALYTVLEFNILEKIPVDGQATVSKLAEQSGLPENKLLRILRLTACEQILEEVDEGVFRHTAISEALVKDDKFKAFIGFQLFETRVASAHLADSLKKKANDYRTGQSAFKHAWGSSLYDWYKTHPEKSTRFDMAMEGVAQSLDPGNALFCDWFKNNKQADRNLVVDVGGGNGHISSFLAEQFPDLSFEVQDISTTLLTQGKEALTPELQQRIKFNQRDMLQEQPVEAADHVLAYILRNVLWNWSDEDCVKLLQTFIPVMEKSQRTTVLVNDGISPARGTFEPHIEKAYRRRDVTVMTMHNTKQRTEDEWRAVFRKASPHFQVDVKTAFTSHSYRGLWEVRWVPAN